MKYFLFAVTWTGPCHAWWPSNHLSLPKKNQEILPRKIFWKVFFQIFEGNKIVSIAYTGYSYPLLNFELLIKLTVTCRCEFGSFYWKYPICFSPPIKLTSKLKYCWKWIQKYVHAYYYFLLTYTGTLYATCWSFVKRTFTLITLWLNTGLQKNVCWIEKNKSCL